MNLPNSLTLLRIFFVPLLVVVLLTREPNVSILGVPVHFEIWGLLIFIAAALTDWADGYFARRRGEITTLGILLDPVADKLLICAAYISLVDLQLVPAWMVVIIIGREITVLGLRNLASAEGLHIASSWLGKTKMVLQVVAACAVMLGSKFVFARPIGVVLLWLVVISAVASALEYFLSFWTRLEESIRQRGQARLHVVESPKKKQPDVAAG